METSLIAIVVMSAVLFFGLIYTVLNAKAMWKFKSQCQTYWSFLEKNKHLDAFLEYAKGLEENEKLSQVKSKYDPRDGNCCSY